MDWMTAEEAGEQWGITSRRVQVLCGNGKIRGAERLGKIWVIPKNVTKPIDGRTKAAKYAAAQSPQNCGGDGQIHEET